MKVNHFLWIKGVLEILISFFIMYNVRFNTVSKYWTILAFLLLVFGVRDLQYFLKLKDEKSRRGI